MDEQKNADINPFDGFDIEGTMAFVKAATAACVERGKTYTFVCPVCRGEAHASRASCNGHVHACCDGCGKGFMQ